MRRKDQRGGSDRDVAATEVAELRTECSTEALAHALEMNEATVVRLFGIQDADLGPDSIAEDV